MSITDAVEQVGGLQTQYAPSGYVGLWTRLADFPRDALTSAQGSVELNTKEPLPALQEVQDAVQPQLDAVGC